MSRRDLAVGAMPSLPEGEVRPSDLLEGQRVVSTSQTAVAFGIRIWSAMAGSQRRFGLRPGGW